MSSVLKLGYIAFMLLALSAIFVPSIYTSLSNFTLKQSGVQAKVREIDKNYIFNYIPESSEDFWDDVESLFSNEKEESPELEEGFFEVNIYPSLVNIFATIIRYTSLVISIFGIILIIYISYAMMGSGDIVKLKNEYRKLSQRIDKLENRIS